MSESTLGAPLLRMGYPLELMVAHGFRDMASALLNERGWHPDVIELNLARKGKGETRRTYNRAARLTDRCKMMNVWADYLDVKTRVDAIPCGSRRSDCGSNTSVSRAIPCWPRRYAKRRSPHLARIYPSRISGSAAFSRSSRQT